MLTNPSLPSITQAEIRAALEDSGLLRGAGVMVHSSLKSFGRVEGGAQAVIAALMDAITPAGTLLMPSFNHDTLFQPGGPGYYHPGESLTTNGAIPDAFWRLPGVQRSLDPTHAVAAWGQHSLRYTQFHHRTLTMGPESPLGLLQREGGYALLLGVDRFMSQVRAFTNLIGNAVAAVVVAKWEKELDEARMKDVLEQ